MTRGRKPNPIPTVEWAVMVPADLALKVELRLMDPATGRARYGARTLLIQSLLYEWMERQQPLQPTPPEQAPVDTLSESG